MNGERRPTVLTEVFCDIISDTLRGDEDQNLSVLVTDDVEMLEELAALLEIGTNFDHLSDVVVSSQFHRTDVDLDEIVQEILWIR